MAGWGPGLVAMHLRVEELRGLRDVVRVGEVVERRQHARDQVGGVVRLGGRVGRRHERHDAPLQQEAVRGADGGEAVAAVVAQVEAAAGPASTRTTARAG